MEISVLPSTQFGSGNAKTGVTNSRLYSCLQLQRGVVLGQLHPYRTAWQGFPLKTPQWDLLLQPCETGTIEGSLIKAGCAWIASHP
jgi:hypothetical protein